MPDLVFADGILARIRARNGCRYDERAYLFVLAAIEYLQFKLDVRRHVTGNELAWACRDLAFDRFGLLARPVLGCWGIASTADFGAIVFTLISVELLSAQADDKESDFVSVYQFDDAFDHGYAIGRWSA